MATVTKTSLAKLAPYNQFKELPQKAADRLAKYRKDYAEQVEAFSKTTDYSSTYMTEVFRKLEDDLRNDLDKIREDALSLQGLIEAVMDSPAPYDKGDAYLMETTWQKIQKVLDQASKADAYASGWELSQQLDKEVINLAREAKRKGDDITLSAIIHNMPMYLRAVLWPGGDEKEVKEVQTITNSLMNRLAAIQDPEEANLRSTWAKGSKFVHHAIQLIYMGIPDKIADTVVADFDGQVITVPATFPSGGSFVVGTRKDTMTLDQAKAEILR